MLGAISPVPPVVPKEFRSGATLPVPVEWLIELHNLAPAGSEVRLRIKSYLAAFGEANEKSHWTRALVVADSGELTVDLRLRDVAIYRGKQETYIDRAQKAFDELQSKLAAVAHFQSSEEAAQCTLQGAELRGTPLVPIRELSDLAKHLQAGAKSLNITVENMALGMAQALAPAPTLNDDSAPADRPPG